MAKHRPLESTVEDGSWFLEAVGAKRESPRARESLAELEYENTRPDVSDDHIETDHATGRGIVTVDSSNLNGDPGTSTSSFDPIPEVPTAPEDLFEQSPPANRTEFDSSLAEPDNAGLAPALNTRRRFRWPVIALAVFVVAAVGAAIVLVPQIQEQQAIAVRQSNYDAALAVRTHLPDSQIALDTITGPTSSDSELAATLPTISSLSNRGATLVDVASEPLPVALPLLAPASLDNLDTFTEQSAFLGADASDIARRLNRGYVFRTSMPKLLITGELVTIATSNDISTLSVILAASLADDASVIADLPDDPAFVTTLALVSSTMTMYAQWQSDYLAALRAQDEDATASLIGDLETMRSDLAETTRTDLLVFRTDIDSRIVDLAGSLDNHLENLSR